MAGDLGVSELCVARANQVVRAADPERPSLPKEVVQCDRRNARGLKRRYDE